jgi:hypothetical protein
MNISCFWYVSSRDKEEVDVINPQSQVHHKLVYMSVKIFLLYSDFSFWNESLFNFV